MKRWLLILLLASIFLPLLRTPRVQAQGGPTPTPTPTPLYCHAQTLFTADDSSCTGFPTVSFPTIQTENAGDPLVVETSQGGFFGGPAAILSISDGGDTWSCQTKLNTGQIRSSVCWTTVGTPGATTVTITEDCTGASSGNLIGDLEEYYTNGGAVSVDVSANNSGHSVTPDSGTTAITGQNTELAAAALAIACLAGTPGNNCTVSGPTNGFTSLGLIGENGSGISFSTLQPTYKLLSATGTQDTSATVGSFTPQWAGNILTLKNVNAICVPPSPPTPTPTQTPTPTPTQTPTPTNSPTQSPTQSPTPTNSPTQSPTRSPTASPTPTQSPVPTPSPSPTPATSAAGIDLLLRPCCIPPVIQESQTATGRQQLNIPQFGDQAVGDFLLLDISVGNPIQVVSGDTGWTQLIALNSPVYGSNTQSIWYKFVTANDVGQASPVIYHFRMSLGEFYSSAIMLRITNVNTPPIDASASEATDLVNYGFPPDVLYNITQMTATAPGLSTSACADAVIIFCATADHNYFVPPEVPSIPAGFGYITDVHDYASQVAFSLLPAPPGAVGPWTVNVSHVGDVKCSTVAVAAY